MPTWPACDTLEAQTQVWLLELDGTKICLLENYERLEYTIAANGCGAVGWGTFRIEGKASELPCAEFLLDRIVSVRRKAPCLDWRVEFEGCHRRDEYWYDSGDNEWYRSSGTDLKSLLRRRVVVPLTGQAFLTSTGPFTDVMRYLVYSQLGALAATARQMPYLVVEPDTGEGVVVTFTTRDSQLSADLETLAGLGAMFDIERVGGTYVFRVHYPRTGVDRRTTNTDGNDPVVFSIDNGNMEDPSFANDRLGESNVVYVAGEGAGALRTIVERDTVWDAHLDSLWNRIEGFQEASQQVALADLMATGDAYLTDNRRAVIFGCKVVPTILCLYGRDWNVGDLVTGVYRDVEYNLSVDMVEISLSAETGEVVVPTLRWIPDGLIP